MGKITSLKDEFVLSGHTTEGFNEAIKSMDEITNFARVDSKDINMAYVYGIGVRCPSCHRVVGIDDTKHDVRGRAVYPDTVCSCGTKINAAEEIEKQGTGTRVALLYDALTPVTSPKDELKQMYFSVAELPEELVSEVLRTRLIFYVMSEKHPKTFVTPAFYADLTTVGIGGDAIKTPSYTGTAFIAAQFAGKTADNGIDRVGIPMTLVIKEIDGVRKIFGLRSGTYAPLKQETLANILNTINEDGLCGEAKCVGWSVNHFFSEARYEFPDCAEDIYRAEALTKGKSAKELKVVPGLTLLTSDTGDASVTAIGTWRVGSSVITGTRVSMRHSKKANAEKVIKEAENKIFASYRILPERLAEWEMVDITDYRKTAVENRAAIDAAFEDIFERVGIEPVLGKRRAKELRALAQEAFGATDIVTLCDVVLWCIRLPERLTGLTASTKSKLADALGGIVHYVPSPKLTLKPLAVGAA